MEKGEPGGSPFSAPEKKGRMGERAWYDGGKGGYIVDTPITRAEHEEFRRRMEEEHKRQDKRIELLEEDVKETRQLVGSVERLATNMEVMAQEQAKQGKRLEELEGRDGEMWRKVVGYIVTAVAGILIGFLFKQIGV